MIGKSNKYQGLMMLMVGFFAIGLIYCGVKWSGIGGSSHSAQEESTGEPEDITHMTLTGVVKAMDTEEGTMGISGIDEDIYSNFTYTDGLLIYDKYDKYMSISNITMGQIVDIVYNGKTNKLSSIAINKDAWEYPNVSKMKVDRTKSIIALGEKNYSYEDEGIIIVGDNEIIDMLDIGEKDLLTVWGIGSKVYSIIVTKGHGYVRFTNYDSFVGGTVTIGSNLSLSVTEDMTAVVREGTYILKMTNGELTGSKKITVTRDKETTVDMSDFTIDSSRIGEVTFHISPDGADLYINGTKTDYDEPVSLNYGEHKIVAYLSGYKTFTGVLTVGEAEQEIDIELVDEDSDEESSSDDVEATDDSDSSDSDSDDITLDWNSDSTGDSDSDSDTSSTSSASPSPSPSPSASTSTSSSSTSQIDAAHKITISEPEGVEVYWDGSYKGVAPVSFTKVTGTHTITLKKDGYTTKKYTVTVEDDSQNAYYSFNDLVEE